MKFHECFKADQSFEDSVNFPYGFAKSGEFTIEQARLLRHKGQAYLELASQVRRPVGEMEREFVAYCTGKKEAVTLHERIWQRYLKKVNGNTLAISFNKRKGTTHVGCEEAD